MSTLRIKLNNEVQTIDNQRTYHSFDPLQTLKWKNGYNEKNDEVERKMAEKHSVQSMEVDQGTEKRLAECPAFKLWRFVVSIEDFENQAAM